MLTEDDDESKDRNIHIQVYTHSNTSHRIEHYYGCYDPLQYPILFPQGECGWHHGVKKLHKRKRNADSCENDFNVDPSSVDDPSHLLDLERRGKWISCCLSLLRVSIIHFSEFV